MSAGRRNGRKGLSLVKGPVAIVGVLGIAMGVAGLIFGGHSFSTGSIPHGAVAGELWLGIELNGWTNLLFIAAGLLLLLGSSMHWGAKTSALIVAGVLGAAAVIALIRGNGIFGIFAANHRTEIIWGAAAVVLVLLSMLPRVGGGSRGTREPVDRENGGVRDERSADDEAVARDDRFVREDRLVSGDRSVADEPGVADDRGVVRDDGAVIPARGTVRDDRKVRDEPVAEKDQALREEPATRERPVTERGARDGPLIADRGVHDAGEGPGRGDGTVP